MSGGADGITDMNFDNTDEYQDDSANMDSYTEDFSEPAVDENTDDTEGDGSDDALDPNEDLVPIDEAPGVGADEDMEGIE